MIESVLVQTPRNLAWSEASSVALEAGEKSILKVRGEVFLCVKLLLSINSIFWGSPEQLKME